MKTIVQYRKLVVAVLGALGAAVAQGLLNGVAAHWVAVAIAAATAAGVYIVPNDQTTPSAPPVVPAAPEAPVVPPPPAAGTPST